MNIKEKNIQHYWWRTILDKNKDCILHEQNAEDLNKFIKNNIPYTRNENGQKIAKGEIYATLIPPKPKSSQTHSISKYKKNLNDFFKTRKNNLDRFKNLNKLIYLCFYLSEKRFKADVDNLAKPVLDALKPYFGDDSKIHTLIVEKKQLKEGYEPEDLDYYENSVIIILDVMTRDNIIKI